MRGGSSNIMPMMMMMMMCMCMASCMMSMMGMGPFGGLFSGASSLIGGAGDLVGGTGDLVGGAGTGAGKALSAAGDFLSGEAFESNLESLGPVGPIEPATEQCDLDCQKANVLLRKLQNKYNF